MEIPTWLDKSFLKAALQGGKDQEPGVTVTGFSVSPVVPEGNNYISHLYRVAVVYKLRSKEGRIPLVVKAPIMSGVVSEIMNYNNMYAMEPMMYNKVLPVLNGLLNYNIGPTNFYSSVKNVLVLEDLKDKGYKMSDRHKQFDFRHCQSVFNALARFHAASVACKKYHPDLISEVTKEVHFSRNSMFEEKYTPWTKDCLRAALEVVKEMELGEVVEDLFKSRIESSGEIFLKHCSPRLHGINVIAHGDFWGNNILFKYTSMGDIEDVKLIDFQVRMYASPVFDLMYLIWTSVSEEVRESKLPELLEMYRKTFNTTLEQLDCKERLYEDEFRHNLREARDLAIVIVCIMLPVTVSDYCAVKSSVNKQNGGILDMLGGKDYLFGGKYFRALLPKVTEHLQAWEKTVGINTV